MRELITSSVYYDEPARSRPSPPTGSVGDRDEVFHQLTGCRSINPKKHPSLPIRQFGRSGRRRYLTYPKQKFNQFISEHDTSSVTGSVMTSIIMLPECVRGYISDLAQRAESPVPRGSTALLRCGRLLWKSDGNWRSI